MLRALPFSLVLVGTAAPTVASAAPFAQLGFGLSLTPGHRIPIGLGFEIEAGGAPTWGGGIAGGSGFTNFEWRGLSSFRATVGGRVLFIGGIGPSVGTGIVARKKGGPGVLLEGGVNATGILGVARAKVDTLVPFAPSRAAELGNWEGATLQETSLVVTAGLNPAYPLLVAVSSTAIDGRPIRDDSGVARLPPAVLLGISSEDADVWLERGRTEHASVPAFLQLAAELAALGAPRDLVGRALEAAEDERRHAVLCYAMAQQISRRAVAVGPTSAWQVRGGQRSARLARLAREALLDGIIGEGDAAARARTRRDAAADELVARVEDTIVVEESTHAALAKDIWMWARAEA